LTPEAIGASFRDPAGYIILENGFYKRIVTDLGKANYEAFMGSGLYENLTKKGQLISHREEPVDAEKGFKKLEPEQIRFITYPYEWSFNQLKDAALLTLDIQIEALKKGFSLKDANPFNIQFKGCRPFLIDTLSFEINREEPWVAYKQFCETFLAPLALMAYRESHFNRYLRVDFHGIDLRFCSQLLPKRTYFNLGLLSHIHLHSRSQAKHQMKGLSHPKPLKFIYPVNKKIALTEHLKSTLAGLILSRKSSFWKQYEDPDLNNYSEEARSFKVNFVRDCLNILSPDIVVDLGCNTGQFSQLALHKNFYTLSVDFDPMCIDSLYCRGKAQNEPNNLPLILDLSNPSPPLGWRSEERFSFFDRLQTQGSVLTLALALIHHLRITFHIPLEKQALFFALFSSWLIIEFIPKNDSMVQGMIQNRDDIFDDMNLEQFEKAFGKYFDIEKKETIQGHQRVLFFMKRKNNRNA